MQKLIYKNLIDEQIDFFHAPYVLSKVTGLGMPDIEYETLRGVYQQGDTVVGFRRKNRVVGLTFSLLHDDRRTLYGSRMALLGILSPDKAISGDLRATLTYENDYGKFVTNAVPGDGLEALKRFQNVQPDMKLSFRCESPYWFDASESTADFDNTRVGLILPFNFPIHFGAREYVKTATNNGHVNIPVQITIQCKGEIPRVFNETTGKRISLVSAIPDGSTLILNTDPAHLDARVIDADGYESSAFGKLSLETPLAEFVLQPGQNELVYEAGGASARSEISVAWRSAYEGV